MTGDDRFEFGLAGPADEPEIRRLVGATPMPGSIALRFEREPDYFLGTTIMGDPCDVIVARHLPDGELAGIMCRAERPAFVNGRETTIGYIGQIRVAERFRGHGRRLMQRGLPLFYRRSPRDLLYWGVTARENPRARALLVEKRPPGDLAATRLSGWTTFGLVLRRQHREGAPATELGRGSLALALERGSLDTIEETVAFLWRCGARRQLYPAYRVEDFVGGRLLRGLALEDVAIARRGGSIVGVVAAWDQSAYKQDVVVAYRGALRWLRPAYDAGARLIGARRLPRVGQAIPAAYASCVCIENDDPEVLRVLLRSVAGRAFDRGFAFLLLGLADADPLLAAARRWPRITYHSDLFALAWGASGVLASLDGRLPYIEIATL